MFSTKLSPFLGGSRIVFVKPFVSSIARPSTVSIQNAQKKGGGSTKNGRDSRSQRRGVKVYGGQPVKAGGIIMRQVGATWYPGENCAFGKDYTVYSKAEGIVVFEHKPEKSRISVYPPEHVKAKALIEATHTVKKAEGELNRKQKKYAKYQPRTPATATSIPELVA